MGLTDRSRLGCIKSRQQRLQRKLEKVQHNTSSTSVSSSKDVLANNSSTQKEAWERYEFAKAIYEETRDMEHWLYMQKCISEYEKALKADVGMKL